MQKHPPGELSTHMQPLTQNLAELFRSYQFSNFPEDVRHLAKLAVIDNLGCAIKGIDEPISKILAEELFGQKSGVSELLSIEGRDLYHQSRFYSVAAHAIDYDDTFVPALAAHTGSAMMGAVWAQALHQKANGEQLMQAVVIGYEIAARVGSLLQLDHYAKGFHSTSTIGVFAACAASASLLGLSAEQFCRAIGIAVTQASGLKCTFGSMAKPFNAGQASAKGLMAARLALKGFSAPSDGLEAEKGYLDMFMGKPESERQVADANVYFIRENAFKFHAACHATHPVIEAIRALNSESTIDVKRIKTTKVTVSPLSRKTASIETPLSGLECKFSFPQVTAFALAGMDTAAENTYSDAVLSNQQINKLRETTVLELDDELHPFSVRVAIEFTDGSLRSKHLDLRELGKEIDFTTQGLNEKFISNTAPKLGVQSAQSFLAQLQNLEHCQSVVDTSSMLKVHADN